MRFISCFKLLCASAALVSSVAIHAAEPPAEPILRIDPSEHTGKIRHIATDEQGRWLATASDDKTLRLWSLVDGRLMSTLRPPIGPGFEGKMYAVAVSPDGTIVAAAGHTLFNQGKFDNIPQDGYSVYMFDRVSGSLLRRLPGLPGPITDLTFSPDGRWLAATLGGKNGVRVFATTSGQLLAEDRDYGDSSYGGHFNNAKGETRLVTTCMDGSLRLYRFDGSRLTLLAKRAAPGGKQPNSARFSPDGRNIAVGFADTQTVNVLDAESLALRFAPDTTGVIRALYTIAWSRDGTALFAAVTELNENRNRQNYIRHWADGGAGAASNWSIEGSDITDLTSLPGGRLAFSGSDPMWGVVNAAGQKVLFHDPVVAKFSGGFENFKLSPDGTQVRFSYESDGKSPAIFDSVRHVYLPADTPNLSAPRLSAPGVTVTDWKNSYSPKINGTSLTYKSPLEMSLSIALMPNGEGGVIMGSSWSLSYLNALSGKVSWIQPAPGAAWGVNVSADGRWVVAAYGDGTIRWHRASDGVEQLAFFPHTDRKRWVMWTPSGYYDASPSAEELIGWHVNRGKDQAAGFFPVSRFRERFYRPDVLTRVLSTQNEAVALAQANEESGRRTQVISIAQVLPPVVEILSPNEGTPVSTASVTLRYNVHTLDDAPVTGIRVRVNGLAVDLPDARNFAVTKASGVREVTIPIPEQNSEIQLFAANKNGISTPATLRVTWAGKKAVPTAEENSRYKPKLYVLSVGVSKYKNPNYNLGLAAKDATDFANVFKKQKGKLYGDVVVHLLTDDKASKDDVLEGLDWLSHEVTSHDVGIMFLAGHGMNDNTGNYYFLPYNVNPEQLKRTGVAQNDIKLTLNSLAGKALFFVDSCHSGNALGTAKTRGITDVNAFVNELASAENGVVVFAASTGRQLSQEDPAWGNGAFTKAVVEGLNGKADFQKTGKITHKGLDYYVTERVKELTKGQQSPVSIAPGGITDFPIALTGK